ncbi:hypothetical protein ABPG72_011230 [Tetrahymena utriculariae]
MLKSLLKLGTNSESGKKKDVIENQAHQLPPNFSDEVFNLELEAEHPNVEIQVINRLVELYAIAIEYYESIKSDKYLIFKNKTRSLLLKQNVNMAIDKAQEELKSEPNEELPFDLKKDKLEFSFDENISKQRQKELELNMKYIQQQDTKESVKTLLNSHSQDIRHNKKIIQRDTDTQLSLIQKRLLMRKIKKHGPENVDTEENEKAKSDNGVRIHGSSELSSKNELDMDIIDITTPAKTEPSASESNLKEIQLQLKQEFMQEIEIPNHYEQMVLSQLDQTRNISNYQDSNQINLEQSYLQNNDSSALNRTDQVHDLFMAQPSSEQKKAKKKKAHVSKKSVMEFQLQNSIIPF